MFYNPQSQQPITLPPFHYSPNSTFRTVDIDVGTGTALDLDLDLDHLDLDHLDIDFHLIPALSPDAKSHSQFPQSKEQEEADTLLAPATPQSVVSDLSMVPAANLMHSQDSWLSSNGQFPPKSAGRASHHRESSLSSLGSAGPASPFSQNTSNPQIAVTDSLGDAYHPHGVPYYDESLHMAKALQPASHDLFYGNRAGYTLDTAAPAAYSALMKRGGDRGLLPPPELSIGSNRSRPVSVASSIADESPSTPLMEQPEDDRRPRRAFNIVPKLDRTMTDVYGDELYSASFSNMSSAGPSRATQAPVSPNHDMFTQRLQAINTQHLHAAHSPVSSSPRGKSPFRHGSPLAPGMGHDFAAHGAVPAPMAFSSVRQMREQNKVEQDARAMREQVARQQDTAAPQTISPKDAILEFHDDGDVNFPLFPQQVQQATFEDTQSAKQVDAVGNAYEGIALDSNGYPFMTTQLPVGLQVPQQYPFIAQPRQQMSSGPSSVPSRVSSAGSSSTHSGVGSLSRPPATNADGGTYTCTYHGCTLRFETPALLQKHKREGHRQAHGLNGIRRVEGAVVSPTGAVLDTQAGPHRCDRINPSTGKPCTTIFSRPYDLTRHEDTIHNGRKQKVRCGLCTEEKTFSRADALTRHYRVCHPDVELPGKHRRRAMHQ